MKDCYSSCINHLLHLNSQLFIGLSKGKRKQTFKEVSEKLQRLLLCLFPFSLRYIFLYYTHLYAYTEVDLTLI